MVAAGCEDVNELGATPLLSTAFRNYGDSLIEAGAPGAKREPDRAKPQLVVSLTEIFSRADHPICAFASLGASTPAKRGMRWFLISVFQINLRNIAFHNHFCSERTGGVCQPLKDITGLISCRRLGQAATLEEQIVRVFVVKVGFSLADLIQHDRMERNR